jgi:hypothetical protein
MISFLPNINPFILSTIAEVSSFEHPDGIRIIVINYKKKLTKPIYSVNFLPCLQKLYIKERKEKEKQTNKRLQK